MGLFRRGPTTGPARRRVFLVEREHPALPLAWTLPSAVALLAGTSWNSAPSWGRGPVAPCRGCTGGVLRAPQHCGGAPALGDGEPPGRAGPKTAGDKQEDPHSLRDSQEAEQKEAPGSSRLPGHSVGRFRGGHVGRAVCVGGEDPRLPFPLLANQKMAIKLDGDQKCHERMFLSDSESGQKKDLAPFPQLLSPMENSITISSAGGG